MRTEDEVNEYMNEAHNLVWMMREQDVFGKDSKEVEEELLKYQEEFCYICKEYDVDFYSSLGDFWTGYWTGILSALRWINGEEKDFLELEE